MIAQAPPVSKITSATDVTYLPAVVCSLKTPTHEFLVLEAARLTASSLFKESLLYGQFRYRTDQEKRFRFLKRATALPQSFPKTVPDSWDR